jgi:hypothetical protein
MSTRNYDIAQQMTAAENTQLIVFGFMDFAGWPLFAGTHAGFITWGGEDWLGLGSWAGVEPIRESIDLDTTKFRLTLATPTQELLGEALYESSGGRRVEIYLGSWRDDDEGLVADPSLIIAGSMGATEVLLGQQSGVSVMVEDVRASLDKINGRRSTMEDHQVDFPGDRFYEFLSQMMDHRYVFNGEEHGGGPGPRQVPDGIPSWVTRFWE